MKKKLKYLSKLLKSENGSSMIENLIAFVILAGVVLIVSSVYVKISLKNVNLTKLEATNLAHSTMEQTIYKKDFIDIKKVIDDKWTITRTVKSMGDRRFLEIQVFRKAKAKLLAECHYICLIY